MNKIGPSRLKSWNIKSSKKRTVIKIFLIVCITLFVVWVITVSVWLKANVFEWLPDVTQVKDMQFQQATIITDKNGEELYKLFEENREYVSFDQMNMNRGANQEYSHIINALVAIEDQRYWEHEGLDPLGILRAAIKRTWWASTLPQQLMTNVFHLKNDISAAQYGTFEYYEERVKYKLRQIVLSKRLNTVLSEQIEEENPSLSSDQIKLEMKKKILEMYLNYIEFWNHSYGIESAAKTYFSVSAKDLSVVQSAVLASLPKWPWQYNPMTEKWRNLLMGSFTITDAWGKEYPYEWNLKQEIFKQFSSNIQQANFSDKKDSNAVLKYLLWLWSFSIIVDNTEYYVKYVNGRKDVVLGRMYEDWYITATELQTAFKEWLTLSFQSSSFQIKAPHFVFWIRDLLKEQYGNDVAKKWLIVKTTLDYNVQQQAEQVFKDNEREIFQNGATNSAMIYIDTNNGDVLAYVGSLNYFDDSIQWQVDMVRSPRQSWSSIKPLLYALGFMKLPLTIDTPIFDLPFTIGGKSPNNADGKFEWLIPLKMALWHSRNIPSVKMFLALWWENIVKPFFQNLWLKSILNDENYGYSLSLGAAEVPMLELASAYSYLTTETPAEINPILEITNHDGSVLYQKKVVEKEEKIPVGVKYLIWNILSDVNNRIVGWVNKFNVSGLTYALKTWTSNVVKNGKSLPRDWWIAAYVPDHLILMWAWNADAAPMNQNAYGGTIHAAPIKSFLNWLLKNNYLSNKQMPKDGTASDYISKINGKRVDGPYPMELTVSSLWYVDSMPTEKAEVVEEISYDSTCIGEVSPLSSYTDIAKWYLVKDVSSFMPENNDLKSILDYFEKSALQSGDLARIVASPIKVLTETPTWYCDWKEPVASDKVSVKFLVLQDKQTISNKPEVIASISTDSNLEMYTLYFDDVKVLEHRYSSELKNTDFLDLNLDLSQFSEWNHTMTLEVIDLRGYMNKASLSLNLQKTDTEAPYFDKLKSSVSHRQWVYDAVLLFTDELSSVDGGKILVDGVEIANFKWRVVEFTTDQKVVDVLVQDVFGNAWHEKVDLSRI